jgi:pyrimidine-nucleoside phosphorylase
MTLDPRAILEAKRDGRELTSDQVEAFVRGVVSGAVPDHATGALLMAVYLRGMSAEETAALTRAMLESGERLRRRPGSRPRADKHSTGGIGDKVSLALAPAAAACGVDVPMISGRGLGHTGGTLDKLEAIPGMRTGLSEAELDANVAELGLAFGAQTERLVPADRKLYALRDATGLIGSIPLIASSILSKKLAEDLDALVLDVKFGSGAFLREPEPGAELAAAMLDIAASFGLPTSVFQTSMERPLGRTAGNALEVVEAIECLRGSGPRDLRELVALLGGEMLALAGVAADRADGVARISRALDDGSGLERFRQAVELQGGDPSCVDRPQLLPSTGAVVEAHAPRAGAVRYADVRKLGQAVVALGGGRERIGDAVDPAVGLVLPRGEGEEVLAGDALALVHHRAGRGLERALALVGEAIEVGARRPAQPLVLAHLGAGR